MQYFLTVPHDSATEPTMESELDVDPAAFEQLMADVQKFNEDLEASGAFRFAGGLQPPSTAKTIDATDGEATVLEEPFVAADAYVGGFWVIDTDSEADAVAWAERASRVLQSRIEIRELQ
ncbi:hypothetical protein HDC37_000806 [Microbacterium sp. AK009]|uniref:YciI family protein n=1 Tax=Microbacterium sp. AK009 TaxID=2723068 RepID=UPI0015CCCF8E|nr:YciI family protein [Microbacterium sp. AK009]NYF15992.1 hypothetical protein [Microbacterium sp. AK009]